MKGQPQTRPASDFDPMAIAVDWLDACRARDLGRLLGLYDHGASLRCDCSGAIHNGIVQLRQYWADRLAGAVPGAFELNEITPSGDRVVLDYAGFEGKPVRIEFEFARSGKIAATRCEPAA